MTRCKLTNRELLAGEPVLQLQLHQQPGAAPLVALASLTALFTVCVEQAAELAEVKEELLALKQAR